MMAGFYVYNNVGIAFRCFATGVLFGIGSAFFLVYNGLMMGRWRARHRRRHGKNLLTFTCGHGAFELTAIVISGAAGMVMGYALVDTRGRTRFGSLRAKAGTSPTPRARGRADAGDRGAARGVLVALQHPGPRQVDGGGAVLRPGGAVLALAGRGGEGRRR
jgi:hypothetical protein